MDILSFVNRAAPKMWSTSTLAAAVDLPESEIAGLKVHLDHCKAERGALFALICAAEAVHTALRGRFITVITLSAVVIAASAIVF